MSDETTPPSNVELKVRLVRPSTMPSIYVEGVSQVLVGFPNSRIMFNSFSQQVGEGDAAEQVQQLACELVVPTPALIEIINGLADHMANNKGELQRAGADWGQKVADLVEALKPKPAAHEPVGNL